MLSLVYLASTEKIELVTDDYYKKELEVNDILDKVKRTTQLKEQVKCGIDGDSLVIRFPTELDGAISGEMFFFRPSSKELDRTFPIETQTGTARIPITDMQKGKYNAVVDWQASERKYYSKHIIVIP
jgi:hypothetical protein